jgi:hypothetical protein
MMDFARMVAAAVASLVPSTPSASCQRWEIRPREAESPIRTHLPEL